jgi:hypothetical protein
LTTFLANLVKRKTTSIMRSHTTCMHTLCRTNNLERLSYNRKPYEIGELKTDG